MFIHINKQNKDVILLKKHITERGKIISRRTTGLCARHQRKITHLIKRARHLALLPFSAN
ncbi:MAG: 30S ribosomal protein S18 [Firmicutes bacterium]|nr:30S ribosomal protein S18 [Bacillota bacterium]